MDVCVSRGSWGPWSFLTTLLGGGVMSIQGSAAMPNRLMSTRDPTGAGNEAGGDIKWFGGVCRERGTRLVKPLLCSQCVSPK